MSDKDLGMNPINTEFPTQLNRICKLLYGLNYEVSLNVYGPSDSQTSLDEAIKTLISNQCVLPGVVPSSPETAEDDIMEKILFEGDTGFGPLKLDSKTAEIKQLMAEVFDTLALKDADMVVEFGIPSAYAYVPVFWDFAYDIHVGDKRWLFIGASSD